MVSSELEIYSVKLHPGNTLLLLYVDTMSLHLVTDSCSPLYFHNLTTHVSSKRIAWFCLLVIFETFIVQSSCCYRNLRCYSKIYSWSMELRVRLLRRAL